MEETYKEKKIWKSIVLGSIIILFLLLVWAIYNTLDTSETPSAVEERTEKSPLEVCFEKEFSYSCATKLEAESEKICTAMSKNTANACYTHFAIREKNVDICEFIQNAREKETCIENIENLLAQEFVNEGETFE